MAKTEKDNLSIYRECNAQNNITFKIITIIHKLKTTQKRRRRNKKWQRKKSREQIDSTVLLDLPLYENTMLQSKKGKDGIPL